MTDEHQLPPTSIDDACATSIDAAQAISDPVDRLLALVEAATGAGDAVRAIDAAISRSLRQALETMTLGDLSRRLHQPPGDILILLPSFATPTAP